VLCVKTVHTGRHLLSARRHLLAIEDVASRAKAGQWGVNDVALMDTAVQAVGSDLLALKRELGPLLALCPFLAPLPRFGGDLEAAPHLLDLGLAVSAAAQSALRGLGPAVSTLDGESPSNEALVDAAVSDLRRARSSLLAARSEAGKALQARERIDAEGLSPDLCRMVAHMDEYLPLAEFGIEAALLASDVLGRPGTARYLLLAQNEDEIRATGGFISGVGLVEVREGQVVNVIFQDSYAIHTKAEAEPPQALEKTMWAQIWLLRDANWSPDFPTAAKVATAIYERDQGVILDGVIAVDQEAIRLLLGALGPVEIKGWERPVTDADFIATIRQAWGPKEVNPGEWWLHRKDFMGVMAQATLHRLEADPNSIDVLQLARAMHQALEEQHILLFMKDPQAAEILAANHWDGAILPAESDYLMVVDTNVGFNKVNPNIEEALQLDVAIQDDGTVRTRLTLTYENKSTRQVGECIQEARYDDTYEGMMDRCYWDYLRVYVPKGTVLLEGTRHPFPPGSLYCRMTGEDGGTGEPRLVAAEKGKDMVESLMVVPPRESREVRLTYQQPEVVQARAGLRQYSLLIQKQPGTLGVPVSVRIELPASANLLTADPAPSAADGSILRYDFALTTARELQVTFH
jgi:hypothetical protein